MWIRSQDIKSLINVSSLEVDGNTVFANNGLKCTPLGTYSCKERALAVLDEIHQGLITATQFDSIVRGERITSVSVYQMPQ